ncbi:hypothetical protein JOB18_002266 [Solea senegalensis]|uniref:Uncharacterized protein n=1 Tax=Solea senegalensis TaxID=28829 RepID=A0AAV6R193_SOLSE|nr:cyclin-I-like [Solea senegalensis]KAG7498222.1 hypothetical protein JOB18_002266 [Solea senegalensis]
MVVSCRSGSVDAVLGLNRSQHLALLTKRLYHCLSDHSLLQLRGSMLALTLITLELETCCPDWLLLTMDLLRRAQINSSELIRSREFVARRLSSLRVSLPPNTVYIYRPLQAPLAAASPGTIITSTSSSSSSSAPPQTPTGAAEEEKEAGLPPQSSSSSSLSTDSSLPVLLSPHNDVHHRNRLKVVLRCKASAKRKVEDMEVDDFYDGIKRLYNEDVTATLTVQEGAIPVTGVLLSRQEGSSSPCPPLQEVGAS